MASTEKCSLPLMSVTYERYMMLKYVTPIPLQKIIKMLAHPTLPIQ